MTIGVDGEGPLKKMPPSGSTIEPEDHHDQPPSCTSTPSSETGRPRSPHASRDSGGYRASLPTVARAARPRLVIVDWVGNRHGWDLRRAHARTRSCSRCAGAGGAGGWVSLGSEASCRGNGEEPMTGAMTHSRPIVRPFLIIVAAFVAAMVVVLVLAISAWTSGSGSRTTVNPSPAAADWQCPRTGPC